MSYPQITHHGSANGVTGSCHELHAEVAHSFLIVCGLFQGADTSQVGGSGQGSLEIEFPLDTLRALIVTHVHIDHVGRIPYLLASGFDGPILCSERSAKLLPIVLEDAFKLGVSRDQKKVESYIELIEQRIIALPYKAWFNLRDTDDLVCSIRLQRADHVLGSAYVEFDLQYPQTGAKKLVVLSGDLGAPHAPLLPAPEPPHCVDILVLESTYGDRNHENRRTRQQRLEAVVEKALKDQGTVLIPAFGIGRTQELLYEMEAIIHSKTKRFLAAGASLLANSPSDAVNQSTGPSSPSSSTRLWRAASLQSIENSDPSGIRKHSSVYNPAAAPWASNS